MEVAVCVAEALPAGVKVGGVAQRVYAGLEEAEAAKVAAGIHGGADLDLCLLQGVAGGDDGDAGGKLADAASVCDDAALVDEGAEGVVRMVGVHGGGAGWWAEGKNVWLILWSQLSA